MREFSPDETLRYARQMILPEIGEAGQRKLKEASVLLVGTGGLGSPSSLYLAAAGIGHLGLVDFDVVDASNLHRQVVHGESTLGQKKVESAKKRLLDINPHIDIRTYDCRLDSSNALYIIKRYDIIADGTDNFATRYLVNDACQLLGKPNVYASVLRFDGQVSVFDARFGPCYRCLFPEPPPVGEIPSCADAGVLGVLPGIAGTLQANEVIKLITGIGDPLIGRLLTFNALSMDFCTLKIKKDPGCALCGSQPTITTLDEVDYSCENAQEISAQDLKTLMSRAPIQLIDVREQSEWDLGFIEGATHIPLGELQERIKGFSKHEEVIVYCKSGLRSARAVNIFRENGFERVNSLKGGITSFRAE